MTLERYRIWKANHTYKVVAAHSRSEALSEAIRRFKLRKSEIRFVGKATSRGRLFKVRDGQV